MFACISLWRCANTREASVSRLRHRLQQDLTDLRAFPMVEFVIAKLERGPMPWAGFQEFFSALIGNVYRKKSIRYRLDHFQPIMFSLFPLQHQSFVSECDLGTRHLRDELHHSRTQPRQRRDRLGFSMERLRSLSRLSAKAQRLAQRRLFAERRAEIKIKIEQVGEEMKAQFAAANSLDLVILVDCTGSMIPFIRQAKDSILHVITTITTISTENDKAKIRVGFVAYRDYCDGPARLQVHGLTEDVAAVKAFIDSLVAKGGGDGPEDIPGGMDEVLKMDMNSGAKRVVLVVDAPCYGREYHHRDGLDGLQYATQYAASPCIREQMRTLAKRGIDFTFIEAIPTNTNTMAALLEQEYKSVAAYDRMERDFHRVTLPAHGPIGDFATVVSSAGTTLLLANRMRTVCISSRTCLRDASMGLAASQR